ncbi:MAG TPA: hypothetical protein VM553_15515, partial [Dongiaceae bacterium]|nr:hypothetical protein [Dongiaceae bacterium]
LHDPTPLDRGDDLKALVSDSVFSDPSFTVYNYSISGSAVWQRLFTNFFLGTSFIGQALTEDRI